MNNNNNKLVLIFGVFDLLHVGHLAALERAASLGDRLFVGVPSDEVVTLDKGRPPVIPFAQRVRMLEALACVDAVVPYHDLEFLTTLRKYQPHVLAVGATWGSQKRHTDALAWAGANDAEVVEIPYTEGVSTTEIRRRITAVESARGGGGARDVG